MIARTAAWKNALAEAIRDPAELLTLLELPKELLPSALRAAGEFSLRVPRGYAALMTKGDPADPLLRQVLPLEAELRESSGFTADPVGDRAAIKSPGLLHKYRGRALLLLTGGCAVHCRYCFRRHFPYGAENPARDDWQAALAHLQGDETIREVILSGGDPLLLDDDRLGELAERLGGIPHLVRLRIHTRLPVVVPERIDERLLEWLEASRLIPIVVIHANHPRELAPPAVAALQRLASAGVRLLNQSVLLQGVNAHPEVLCSLSEALFEAGVLPYYLHQLDRVQGAAHFEVSDVEALALAAELRERLPGYLVPRLVRETPGAPSKIPLFVNE